jgi:hypothetical protein
MNGALGFFPDPYEDEILYSVFARYHIRSGSTSPKATLGHLFGNTSACAIIDLPCNLGALVDGMPERWGYSVESLIYGHTLFPLYEPFLLVTRAGQIFESMKGSRGGSIHTRAGIMASSVVMPRFIRFCPECVKEDKANHGELYWRRLHQVPCVLVCPQHKKVLLNSTALVHGLNKHEFVPAGEENCACRGSENSYSDNVLEKLITLADDVSRLLATRNILNSDGHQKTYLSRLADLDLATATGRVYQRDLAEAFVGFYGLEFLKAVQSCVLPGDENTWLADIARKRRKAQHPIRHLLLIRFLGGSVEWLKSNPAVAGPFGKGPWPCLNPAAEHYRESVVGDLKVSHCYDTKRPVGTFTCSCGFVYSRRGPDQALGDKVRIGRIKAFGPVWDAKLRSLVEQEMLGLNETARRLGADPMTVRKYANLLGLAFCWKTRTTAKIEATSNKRSADDQIEIEHKHRKVWIGIQEQHKNASKTRLRNMAPGTYAWLYRHDRSWLNHNSPAREAFKPKNGRVDWANRDAVVLEKVEKVIEVIKTSPGKPERVSVSRVGKITGTLSLLERHLDKMPLTMEFLGKNVEDVSAYQDKRIAWAIREICSDGEFPRTWRVLRLSGLRPEFSKSLTSAIDSEIKKYLEQELAELECSNSETGHSGQTNRLR